jgi:hypothetical protein
LIVQFKARDKEEIKDRRCIIDCCILPRASVDPHACTARYGLYRLIWRGWMRMAGIGDPVSLGGLDREFRYWSGTPCWSVPGSQQKFLEHPDAYQRKFDLTEQAWYWENFDGTPVTIDGRTVWDTGRVW